ncbi:hypothetical protein, conserved [Plasmodium gonderi]|uniref:SET domain protein n=1 Tax=Plasmodium gonderi TaxID=77519 RepID=A0A1Y1JN48_PLAGO|nr:hypothetical protein, conserved [Plasmodium gonderi]GAW81474.1 hypothetical protein, conserved [Plasmodium gonderi]
MLYMSLLRDIEKRGLGHRRREKTREKRYASQKGKDELIEIVKELPKLYERNEKEIITSLVTCFIERNPKYIDAYELFSTFYFKIKDYNSALNLLFAALYLDHNNEKLTTLLKLCEECQVSKYARIPIKYKEWIFYPERRETKRCVPFVNSTGHILQDLQGSDSREGNLRGSNSQGSDSQGSDSQGSDSQGSDSRGNDSRGNDVQRRGEDKNRSQRTHDRSTRTRNNGLLNKALPSSGFAWDGFQNDDPDEQMQKDKIHIAKHGKHYIALAKKDLEPGEIIFQTKPFIVTQHIFCNNYVYRTCYHCLKERNISQKCYACPVNPHTCTYIFCSWKCLTENMKIHKAECPILPIISAAAKEANLMHHLVLHIFRVLIKARIDKEYKDKEKNILNEIFNNESFYDVVKENQIALFNSFNTLANRIILEFPSTFYLYLKQKELVEFMLIVWQYSHFIKYYSPSSIIQQTNPEITFGLVYSPQLAKMHHSCVPTCTFYYDENGFLTVRSLCNIPQGGKLCISILTDQYVPLNIRKSFRGIPRIFTCGCIRCTDPTENNLHLRSMKCPKCIIGYIYPIKTDTLIEALKLYKFQHTQMEDASNEHIIQKSELKNIQENRYTSNVVHSRENGDNNIVKRNSHIKSTSQRNGNDRDDEKGVYKKLEGETEKWLCSNCGKLSLHGSKRCTRLEHKIYVQFNQAENNYMKGNIIQSKKQLLNIYNEVRYLLHPNHYILFNVHVLLAGLMRHDPNKELYDSLIFLRKAIIAGENVLPVCSLEKVHLYAHLSHYTFSYSNFCKLYMKGAGVSAESIIEPIFASIFNSVVTTGYNSTLTISLIQHLRTYAIHFNIYTPYKEIEFCIHRKEEFSNFYHHVTQKKNESYRKMKKVMKEDPFYPIYMACQCFDIDYKKNKYLYHTLKLYRNIKYVGNGQNALSIAAAFGNINLVKILLKLNYSLFSKNELHMNALLHMASSFLPDEQTSYHSNYFSILLKEIESQKVHLENFEIDYSNITNGFKTSNTDSILMQNEDRYMNSCHLKNDTERPFSFDNLLFGEEFTYGSASRQLDINQKIILTLFLKHLDNKHLSKRKKYKSKLKFNKRLNFSNVIRRKRDSNRSFLVPSSRFLLPSGNSAIPHRVNLKDENLFDSNQSNMDSSNILWDLNDDKRETAKDFSSYKGLNNIGNMLHCVAGNDSLNSMDDFESLEDHDSEFSKKKKNYIISKSAKRRGSSKGSNTSVCSSFDSAKSDDILNNKLNHYYVEKFLTKSISHKLLGLNNALHYACIRGKRKLSEQLIISGIPVMLLNAEGSTPLHMASLNGHDEIVKTLIKYKSEVNFLTSHGETPLMLAAYGLHVQVIKTLVANGADVILKNNNNVTVLHCLVHGLLRTHTIYYEHASCNDDALYVTNGGLLTKLNPSKMFTQPLTYLDTHQQQHLRAHIPIIEDLPNDFYILPFKLLHRIKKAIVILKYLMMYCPLYIYDVKNSNGYNPFELLKAIWRKLSLRRMHILTASDLKFSAFTHVQKNIIHQGWSLITALIHMFMSILRPDRSVLTSIYTNFLQEGNQISTQIKSGEEVAKSGEEVAKSGEEVAKSGEEVAKSGEEVARGEDEPMESLKVSISNMESKTAKGKQLGTPKKMWLKKTKMLPTSSSPKLK